VWAGIFLIIFHAAAKSLLFLCVGTAEHHIGSRDIEDMDALFVRMPYLARSWRSHRGHVHRALRHADLQVGRPLAFIDSDNIVLVFLLVFGSPPPSCSAKWLASDRVSGLKPTWRHGLTVGEVPSASWSSSRCWCPSCSRSSRRTWSSLPPRDVQPRQRGISTDNLYLMAWSSGCCPGPGTCARHARGTKTGPSRVYGRRRHAGREASFYGPMARWRPLRSATVHGGWFGEARLGLVGVVTSSAVLTLV